jgi:DNA polymerase III subunit epsilon
MTTHTEEVRRYSLPGDVTKVIEVTGNQYAKRHTARATEGRDLGFSASTTGILGLCVQCAGMRAHDLRSLEGDRVGSVAWATGLLESGGFCVLDSETTGLKPPVGFVEVAVVDADAKTLFEGTVRPDCHIEPGATRIHGYTTRSLADSPPFLEVYPDLLEAIWGRRVIVYNASYDRRVWDASVRSLGARGALAGELPAWECAMRRYAAYVGEPSKRGGYRSQKLPGGDHSALGDALATLRLIEEIAAGPGGL